MVFPALRVRPALAPCPDLADGEVLVATRVHHGDGRVSECPAWPLLAGTYAGRGYRVRSGPVRLLPGGSLSAFGVVLAAADDDACPGAVLAVGSGDRAMLDLWAAAGTRAGLFRPRTVLLAAPRSFCAGVERAIEVVETLIDKGTPGEGPVFVRKQIVHNTHVIKDLEERGAVFVEELDEVPAGARVVFSAHGVSPQVRQEASRRALRVVDATCPLVTKVHNEARRFARRGDTVILIGHAGHEEVEGTLGEAPRHTVLVQTPADVADLVVPDPERVSYLTQTTLAVEETREIIAALRARFPAVRGPESGDICYATTNRQEALRGIAADADVVLVLGSVNSSNSVRLVELAHRGGTPAHLVDDVRGISLDWLRDADVIGLTAGASAPPALVREVIAALGGLGPVTVSERVTTVEDVHFAPPATTRNR